MGGFGAGLGVEEIDQVLARAFQQAGARAVVASRWPLRDDAAEVLVRELYDRLAQGAPLGAALRGVRAAGGSRAARSRPPSRRRAPLPIESPRLAALPLPLALAALAAFSWSFCDLTRRVLARRMPAWALSVWVTLGALPILALWCVEQGAWRIEPAAYLAPGAGAIGINLLANFAFFRSLQLAPLSVTLPMLSLTPAFSLGLGALLLGERLEPRALAGAALVVAGAFLLAWRRSGAATWRFEPGSLLMGLVAMAWSTTLLLDKVAMKHAAPPLHALIVHGGVALAGLAVLTARRELASLGSIRGNSALLAATVAFSVLGFGAQLYAVRDLPIGLVDTLKRAVGGALAVVWDRAFFGEPVTPGKLAAVTLLSGGVALLTL